MKLNRGRVPTVLIVSVFAACLVVVAWLSTRVFDELSFQHSAPRDNVQWAASQIETEAMRMHLAAVRAMSGQSADLDEFRKRFDIFFSRVDLVRSGKMFRSLRADPTVAVPLDRLSEFLADTVPVVDGPDVDLLNRLPEILTHSEELQIVTRELALATVTRFARKSDEERQEFSDLLTVTSIIGLAVIVLLMIAAILLVRQISLAHAREVAIRRSEERLAAMVDSALDAVIVMDAHGTIIDYNPSATGIFGYTRDEAIGQPLAQLIIPPQFRDAHSAGLKRHLETGETAVVGHGRFELSAINSRGEEFPVEFAVGRSIGEDGPIFVAYLRDIAHRKESEASLREARDRAEAADRAKSEFLAVMSHEMRTPLNGVLGAVDLLRSTDLDPKQARYVGLAEMSGEILLQHISDVLDITKIEAGRLEIETEAFDPVKLVRELAEVTEEEAFKRDNQIAVDISAEIAGEVVGDPHRIRQVLLNLLANAIKFTSEGRITVGLRRPEGSEDAHMLEFSVQDTGIGIAEEDCARLFDEFVVLNPSYTRDVGGAGLGLAISRRIVTALEGEIGVESRQGEGSRFWFRIPLPSCQTEMEIRPDPSPSGPEKRRGTVLLAEDNATNRIIAAEMLGNAGYTVITAEDGAEAVRLAERNAFDIILMDISMPRMDGIEATKRIRRGTGASRDARIIGVTAHALPSEIDRFNGAGMQGCLTKPLRLISLLNMLEADALPAPGDRQRPAIAVEQGAGAAEYSEIPIFDPQELDRLRNELRPASLDRLMRSFGAELETAIRAIAAAHDSSDWAELQRRAHGLHGSAASVGAARLAAQMAAVELACKAGQFEEAGERLGHLDEIATATAEKIGTIVTTSGA